MNTLETRKEQRHKKRKTWRIPILASAVFLCSFLSLSAATSTRVVATVTITNVPTSGDTFVLESLTRTWGTSSTATTILTNLAGVNESMTNLFDQIAANPYASGSGGPVYIRQIATNQIRFTGRSGNTLVIDDESYLSVSYNSFTGTNGTAVRVPYTAEPTATTQTNIANDLVEYIGIAADSWATNAAALANFLNIGPGNQDLTAGKVISNGIFSNIVAHITSGTLSSVVVNGITTTNLVNYGNAISSPGSAANSEQIGTGSSAVGANSLAVGGATATESSSVAIGQSAISKAVNGLALGASADVWTNAAGGIAIGNASVARTNNMIAIGTGATGYGLGGISIGAGANVPANHTNSIAIGANVAATETNQIMLGGSGHKVRIDGQLQTSGIGITNPTVTGRFTNSGSYATPAVAVTTLADGDNSLVISDEVTFIQLTGSLTVDSTLDGITNGWDGRSVLIQNKTGYTVEVKNESGLESFPINRILTPTAAGVDVANKAFASFVYDATASRWTLAFMYDGTVGGGGGGLASTDIDTSSEIAAIVTDETGSGALVFGTSPTIVTPTIASFANATHDHQDAAGGGQLDLTAAVTGILPLANGGTGASLSDPGADRIKFWDDSAGAVTWLTVGSGLSISTTTLSATGGGGGEANYNGLADSTTNTTTDFGLVYGKLGITNLLVNLIEGDGHVDLSMANPSNLQFSVASTVTLDSEWDTSAEILAAVGDETGSGALVFGTSPTITTPTIASFANSTHNHEDAAGGGTLAAAALPAAIVYSTEIDTSSELAGILTDETGSGALVFGTSPTIVTPTIASFANAAHDHEDAAGGGTLAAAALPAAIIYSTEIDTSAELATIVTDETGSGALVFGTSPAFTTVITLPNGADAPSAVSSEGHLFWDSDDDALAGNDGSADVALPFIQSETFTIMEPDQVQPINDTVLLKHFNAETYPNGVTIKDIIVTASASNSDSYAFEEWSSTAKVSDIETGIAFSASTRVEDDGTLADSAMAADNYIMVNLPATPTDIAYVAVTVTWTVNANN